MAIKLKNGETGQLKILFADISDALYIRTNVRYLLSCYEKETKEMPIGNRGNYDHKHVRAMADALGKPDLEKALNVEEIQALANIRIKTTIRVVEEAIKTLKEKYNIEFEDGDLKNPYEKDVPAEGAR